MNLKKLFYAQDMTVGTPWKRIAQFAVPMLIGNIAQQLYSTVDAIVVGRYLGDNALSAVGSTMAIINLAIVLMVGVSVGAGIMVSQYFGAKKREELSQSIGACMVLTIVISIFMSTVLPALAVPLLRATNTPETILNDAASYLRMMGYGAIGLVFYNIFSGILRGLGDSFTALVFLLISTGINIGLDILFVSRFGLGVFGVALATVIAQVISAILCFIKLRRMDDIFSFSTRYLRFNKEYIGRLLKLGLPSGISQGVFSVAMMFVQSLTNQFGETLIACNTMIMRVDGFAILPIFTFANAMTTYTGQNIGANRMERVQQGIRQGLLMSVGTSVVVVGLILIFGRSIMGLFTTTESLIDFAMRMMRVLGVGYLAMAVSQTLFGVMRGAGDTMTPMWASIVSAVIIRVPVAYLMTYLTRSEEYPIGRPEMIFWSILVAWTLGAVISVIAFSRGNWRNKGFANQSKEFVQTEY